MIKNYFILDDKKIIQFVSCDELEICKHSINYVETTYESFIFDSRYDYFYDYGEIVTIDRTDDHYLEIIKKQNRQYSVENITVNYNGIVYQGDEISQGRMSRAIIGLNDDTTTIKWKAKDNSINELNRADLKQIINLSCQEQTRLWLS